MYIYIVGSVEVSAMTSARSRNIIDMIINVIIIINDNNIIYMCICCCCCYYYY